MEGAIGGGYVAAPVQQRQQQPVNPHYENIYEAIEPQPYAAAVAAAAAGPADVIPVAQIVNLQQNNATRPLLPSQNHSLAYRNELYDRTAGVYDVPRNHRRLNNPSLQFDLNAKRPRYNTSSTLTARPQHQRQRSFDDTESFHNYIRYENIYEQIHEEPIYSRSTSNGGRVYGRLDVIGHGIGRIERHLSSSCGNIDHYNLGGHYAVLGHSHLGTMGHIRLNATQSQLPDNRATTQDDTKPGNSFFSCLGGENSQSMSNIYKATNSRPTPSNNVPSSSTGTTSSASSSRTGAIPKTSSSSAKKPSTNTQQPKRNQSPEHSSSLNRISKSSLQWLLVNKWLPLWVGGQSQDQDYKVIDFNFMFSRNCEGCGETVENRQSLLSINRQMQQEQENDYQVPSPSRYVVPRPASVNSVGGRVLRNNPNLVRLRECDHNSLRRMGNGGIYDNGRSYPGSRHASLQRNHDNHDPFRNWELNAENNTFRPAGGRMREVRRITDGTFRVQDLHNLHGNNLLTVPTMPSTSTTTPSSSSSSSTSPPVGNSVSVANDPPSQSSQPNEDSSLRTDGKDEAIYYQNSECTEDDQDDGSELSGEDDDAE